MVTGGPKDTLSLWVRGGSRVCTVQVPLVPRTVLLAPGELGQGLHGGRLVPGAGQGLQAATVPISSAWVGGRGRTAPLQLLHR